MAEGEDTLEPWRLERQARLDRLFDEIQSGGKVVHLPVRERLTRDELALIQLFRGLPPQKQEGFNLALAMLRLGQ